MSTQVKETINERTTYAIEHFKRTGGLGSKQTDPLTEEEVSSLKKLCLLETQIAKMHHKRLIHYDMIYIY